MDLAAEECRIRLFEVGPFFWKIIKGEDGRHWANWYASPAIDTFYRIDVKQFFVLKARVVFLGMNTVDWARVHAGRIFCTYAGFGDNVCHTF